MRYIDKFQKKPGESLQPGDPVCYTDDPDTKIGTCISVTPNWLDSLAISGTTLFPTVKINTLDQNIIYSYRKST